MPTRILIARGSLEGLQRERDLEDGELFWQRVQPESNQDGTLIIETIGSEEPVEPISTVEKLSSF
jgi:hypothetical protein